MNNIINKYIILRFSKVILVMIIIFFGIGVILNLFEEIEFLKKYEVEPILPVVLTISLLPDLVLNHLHFIVFLSSIWYLRTIKNNKDLLSLKLYGLSNIKIAIIVSYISFTIGVIAIIAVNPISSSFLQYYEKTKAMYSDEVNHLISFNKNGIWIRDNSDNKSFIINAGNIENNFLKNISIFEFDDENTLVSRIDALSAEISTPKWRLDKVKIYNFETLLEVNEKELLFNSNYDLSKINSIYKNTNTLSLINLINNYDDLILGGYNEEKLKEKIHNLLSLPVYLFLMVLLASIFILKDLSKKNDLRIIFLSIFTCVSVFYLKDLSIALGQTGRIDLLLSVWIPIIILSTLNVVGLIQINEK